MVIPTARPAPSPELLAARALAADRNWSALAEQAVRVDGAAVLAEPELGYLYADALWRVGNPAASLELGERIEEPVRRCGDPRLLLRLVNLLGMARFETGELVEAELRFGQLLERAAERGDDEFAARASNNLGVLANVRGRRDLALTYYQRALASYQRLGYLRGLAQTHYNLGVSYRELGFAREAVSHYTHAVRFGEQAGSEDVIALAESDRGLLCVQTGDPRMAEAFAGRARDRFERLSDPVRRAEALRVLAAAARARSRVAEALSLYEEALAVARSHANLLLHGEVQRDRGSLLLELGQAEAAGAAWREAALQFERLGAAAEANAVRSLAASLPAR